mgnify:CR=1 FL=1
MQEDVQQALDLIKNITIDVFYRNINSIDTLFYIKFVYDKTIWYLRRFLEQDIIQNILNTMVISVNEINSNGTLIKKLISLDINDIITKYIDDVDITYVIKHSSENQIININGIFDKKNIDMLKYQGDTASISDTYIPSDVIIINNTQKTN